MLELFNKLVDAFIQSGDLGHIGLLCCIAVLAWMVKMARQDKKDAEEARQKALQGLSENTTALNSFAVAFEGMKEIMRSRNG